MPLAQRMMMAGGFLSGGPPPGGGMLTIHQSSFIGTNGTNIGSYTPDIGDAWVAQGAAVITIQGNKAVVQTDGDYIIPTYYSSGRIRASFQPGTASANNACGFIFRALDSTHYMMAYFSGEGNLYILKRENGVFTSRGNVAWSGSAMEMTFYANELKVYVDSVLILSYTTGESDYYGTGVGFRGFNFGGAKDSFDDFIFDIPEGLEYTGFPGGMSTPVFADDFGDPNGTALTATGWTNVNASFATQTGHAENGAVGGAVMGYMVVVDTGEADHAVKSVVTTAASGDTISGNTFRHQDGTHFLEHEVNTRADREGPEGTGVWIYNNTGVFLKVMHHYFVPSLGATYTMRAWASDIYVWAEIVEAGIVIAGICNYFTDATKVGLFEARASGALSAANHFDDFEASV